MVVITEADLTEGCDGILIYEKRDMILMAINNPNMVNLEFDLII